MNPSEAKEIKEALKKNQQGITEGIHLITNLVAEEVSHITKNQKEHQEKDDKMFGELKEGIIKTQVNHDEIIKMLQKSADDRKIMGKQIETLITTQEQHKKIVSRGEGIMWILGGGGLMAFADLIHRIFSK